MHVAILGATGAVGRTMLDVLAEREFPVDELTLLASERSAGSRLSWQGREYTIGTPRDGTFRGVDVALFSAGGARSREWAPRAAEEGALVVDNSSAWRMDPEVPLVVPEVNPEALSNRSKGIIANPNCSTIQVVVALQPIHRAAGVTRVVLTTFQSVSGAGEKGREALRQESAGQSAADSPFTRSIAANAVPQIGPFDADGWSEEERKMINEPRKIMGISDLRIAPTCVRVPVEVSHSVEMMVELGRDLSREEVMAIFSEAPGVVVAEAPDGFPTPRDAAGRDEVFVGRIRKDLHIPRTLHLWVVADNLRKGAATNAVQIAEELVVARSG
ncbi:MAG: aspartate-semialdehyde dehydrogenase [Gemmatimonas sp.]|nr:aspartate-semialdehyde dehydrogenase [Gemmatimonas sp.]